MPEITVPRGEKRGKPITVDLEASSDVRISLAEAAAATVNVIVSDVDVGKHHHTIDVVLGEEASLMIVTVTGDSSGAVDISQHSRIGEKSSILWQNVTLGGDQITQHLISEVDGDHAESNVEWVFYAKGSARHELSARNVFRKGNGGGEITVKGVTQDEALARIKGMIDIAPSGGGTQTFLRADALMLDRTSKVDIVPALEIKTNDVKASHAATVSRVTEEELFYFASRGIFEEDARRMYILGFLGDLVEHIVDRNVKNAVQSAIGAKLQGSMEILL